MVAEQKFPGLLSVSVDGGLANLPSLVFRTSYPCRSVIGGQNESDYVSSTGPFRLNEKSCSVYAKVLSLGFD